MRHWLGREVVWRDGASAVFPYVARVDGHDLVIRLGDFPEEDLYTLIVDGVEVGAFNDWPSTWDRSGRRASGPTSTSSHPFTDP